MDPNFVPFTFGRGVTAVDAVRCNHLSPAKTRTAQKRLAIRCGKFGFAAVALASLCCAPGSLLAQNGHWHHRGGWGRSGGGSGSTSALASLTCATATLTGAASDACTVTLTQAASTDTTVTLASSSAAVTLPASVVIPSGATSAGFAIAASAVTIAQSATLTASNGSSSQAVALQLNPAADPGTAALTLGSTTVAFGNVNLNTPATQTVQITSSGTAALTINAASVAGTGFSMSGLTMPVTLSPGQSAALQVQFNPTAAGAQTGTLTISSNAASGGTSTIALSGAGSAASSYAVQLNWAAPASSDDEVAGYNVYRAVNGGAYQKLNSSVNQPTTYNDTTAQSGTAYTYEVMSVDASGVESAPSNVFSAAIP